MHESLFARLGVDDAFIVRERGLTGKSAAITDGMTASFPGGVVMRTITRALLLVIVVPAWPLGAETPTTKVRVRVTDVAGRPTYQQVPVIARRIAAGREVTGKS